MSSRKAKRFSPALNCLRTSSRASCLPQRKQQGHHGVTLLPSFSLWDAVDNSNLVFPQVLGWGSMEHPYKRKCCSAPINSRQSAQHRLLGDEVTSADSIYGRQRGFGVELSDALQSMGDALTLPSWTKHTGGGPWRAPLRVSTAGPSSSQPVRQCP